MANDKLQRVGLEFTAEGVTDYKKALNGVSSQMKQNQAEFKLLQSQYDEHTKSSKKLADQQNFLSKQYEEQQKRVSLLRTELQAMESDENADSKAIENKQIQLTNAQAALNKYGNELKSVNEKVKKGTADLEDYTKKINDMSDKVTKVGEEITKKVTGPILAIGAGAIASWKQTDDAYDNIIEKTGATGEAAAGLADIFDVIYGNFPFESANVSDAIGAVNTQFKLTGMELEAASLYLLKYAQINKTDIPSSTQSAKKAIETYNLTISDLPSILDSVTKTSQNTGVAVDELMSQAIEGAPSIKALGLSFAEGVTLLGNFQQAGVDSGAALSSLSKATIAYAKDGKTLSKGLKETQEKILKAKNETEALNIAAEVFGTKGAVRMVDAIKRGTINLSDLASQSQNTAGTVENTFAATQDPLDKATVTWNNLKLALSSLGGIIQEMLGPILEGLSEKIQELTIWFKNLSPEQQKMIVIIGLIIAAVGPLIIILGALIGAIGSIASAITFLAANPIVLIIAAIIAVIAIFILFGDKIKEIIDNVFNVITDVFGKIKGFFEGTGFLGIFAGVIQIFENVLRAVKNIFGGIIDFIAGIFTGNWKKAWEGIKNIFGGVFGLLFSIAVAPINLIIGALNGLITGVNVVIKGLNMIKLPDWDILGPLAGKGINIKEIGKIPYLANGGDLLSGMAVVAEAGPELLLQQGNRTRVVPLTESGGSNQSNIIDYDKMTDSFIKALSKVKINLDKNTVGKFIDSRVLRAVGE
jgi:phage-related minor tail protein